MGDGYDVVLRLSYTGEIFLVFQGDIHHKIFPIIEVPQRLAEFIGSEIPVEYNG